MKNEKFLLLLFYVCLLLFLAPSLIFADIDVPELVDESNPKDKTIKLRQKFEDWNKEVYNVPGASISYSDDRIENTSEWQTQGSVIYPIQKVYQKTHENLNQDSPTYTVLTLLPSIAWNYLADIEELTFQLPIYYTVGHNTDQNDTWRSDFYFSPFYLTDFDFEGAMIGAELKYEPTILIGGRFQVGKWHSLTEGPGIDYYFRILPGLTYSRIISEGSFIDRQENDDMFAITTSLELRFKTFGTGDYWEIYGTYDLLYDFSGDSDGYLEKWGIGTSWWFTKNVGLSFTYEKGNMLLTNKEIDLVRLNLQLRL